MSASSGSLREKVLVGRRAGGGSALAVPAFRRLWIAGIVSDTGDWLMFTALPLVVLQLTGSAFGTSVAFLLELAPPVLLAPLVGRLVDRLPGQGLMVAAMLAQAVSLLPLLAVHDRSDLPVVYGVIVAQATFATVFEPTKNGMLPTLVGPERIVSANALVGLNNNLGRVVGAPLGGVLLAAAGLGGVALTDIATYLVAAALVVSLPKQRPARRTGPSAEPPPRQGGGVLRALREPGTGVPIAVVVFAAIAQGLFLVVFVFFVTDVLGGDGADVGLLRGVQAMGAIAAGVALGVLGARLDVLRLTLVGVSTFAALTAVTWNISFLSHAVPLYAVLFGVLGAPAVLMDAGLVSLLQQAARAGQLGSVFAALGLGRALGQAAGLLAGGLLLEAVGTLTLMDVQAGCYVIAALLAIGLLPRSIRSLRTRQINWSTPRKVLAGRQDR